MDQAVSGGTDISVDSIVLVDTTILLTACLRDLQNGMAQDGAVAAVDCEGVGLGRTGRLCTLQIRHDSGHTIYVIDVVVLGARAFSTSLDDGFSLRCLLEDEDSLKLMFDPRNDSEALYHQFGILMQNVVCLQLAEVAWRRARGRKVQYLKGLDKVMQTSLDLSAEEMDLLSSIKAQGKRLFASQLGGSFELWESRPLNPCLLQYAACDVMYMIKSYDFLTSTMSENWMKRVTEASGKRIRACLGEQQESNKARAPIF